MSYFLTAARHSIRAMFRQRDRSHRLTVLATLIVTLGASVAIFAVINALWLKPLPFADPASLYVLWHVYPGLATPQGRVDAPGFAFYQRAETPFADLAAVTPARSVNLARDASADPSAARQVSITPNFFRLFGVPPTRGRAFTNEDAQRGAPPVAVVSTDVWTRHFGDAALSGQKLYIDGDAVTVVGVLPRSFQVLERSDIWRPLWLAPRMLAPNQIGNEFLTVFGRSRRSTTPAEMASSLAGLTSGFRVQYPAAHAIDPRWHIAAEPLADEMLGGIAPVRRLLLASVVVLVVVGFVNVANLMLAQSVTRRHEAAVKTAIGSSRARLLTDFAAEALVLSVAAAVIGLIAARVLLDSMLPIVLAKGDLDMPPWNQISIDGVVMAFGVGVALVGGFICAVVPSLNNLRTPVATTLVAGARSTLGHGQRRVLNALVALEVATASLLVVASGLLVESILRLGKVDPGFRAADVSAFDLALPQRRYPDQVSVQALQARLMENLATAPGIESAGFVSALPFRQPGAEAVVEVEGGQAPAAAQPLQSTFLVIGRDYFRTLRIPLRQGRLFGAQDRAESTPVVVIDDAAARYFWPTGEPVGRRLQFTFEKDPQGQPVWREVVGIVGHIRTQQLQASTDFQFYVPTEQMPVRNVTYVVRGGARDLVGTISGAVRSTDPALPLHDFAPMVAIVGESFAQLHAAVAVVTAFGSMAIVLTGIGVYGVISYLVASRRNELGIKLALGASAGRIRSEVLRWALRFAVVGFALAVPAALALSWSIRSLLFGISPFNPLIQAGASVAILALVVLASYRPAAAAARIDPVQTLRQG